ncbi:hypothetical protein Maes01_02700 [Microbulbifer aestuariivivens]|uniref:DUF1570 domain-containing protein n=2 Tax=Microbulbifer aestuariivivens TaxID=1908308 RepID=A0ABP9WVQ7_9GAMM
MVSRAFALLAVCCGFLLSACSVRELADDTWYEVHTGNFRIVTNGNPEAVDTLARDLERYRAVALNLLGTKERGKKLTIYAAADRITYAGLVGPELAEITNGLFDTTAEGSYALVNLDGRSGERQLQAREFLFHEYTHYLSYHGNTLHYPYWYSEGFAEFMSTMTFPRPGHYQLGAIPQERALTLIYTEPLPLETLLRATVMNTPDEDKGRVYASGWMLTHWLLMESGRVDQLRDYLKAYNRGEDPVAALEKTFGVTLQQVAGRYNALFQEGDFDMVAGRVPASFEEATPHLRPLSPRSAVAEVARFLVMSGYHPGGLGDLLQYAQVKGLESPELTATYAEAALQAGDFDFAADLLASIPVPARDNVWFQRVDAWLQLNRQMYTAGEARDREQLKAARDKFVQLVNKDEQTASHWYGLAVSMEMLAYPRDEYLEMLEQAYLRAPRQVHIAQWLAMELYQKQDADYFARVAQPLLMDLNDEEEYRQIKDMLAELQEPQRPAGHERPDGRENKQGKDIPAPNKG